MSTLEEHEAAAVRAGDPHRLRRHRGVTMLEVLIWLGIAALILAGAAYAGNTAMHQHRVNQARQQLMEMQARIAPLYHAHGALGSAEITQMLINRGTIPSRMVSGAGASQSVTNPWRGAVTVHGLGVAEFAITYAAVPRAACAELATSFADGEGGGFLDVQVNSTTLSPPVTPAEVDSACVASNTLRFRFNA